MTYDDYCLDILKAFIEIPSPSTCERTLAHCIQEILCQIGMVAELEAVSEDSFNVYGKYTFGKGGAKIILGGHLDTVKPTENWTYAPFKMTVEGDAIYGLGAADMKGGLASQIAVIKKMIDTRELKSGTLLFVGLADEERYSRGAEKFVERMESADFAILAEPHYHDVVYGATGKALLEIHTIGKTGHASRPEEGVNAIESLMAFMSRYTVWQREKYRCGDAGSSAVLCVESAYSEYSLSIPEACRCTVNKQLLSSENLEEHIAEIYARYSNSDIGGELVVSTGTPCYPAYEVELENAYMNALLQILDKRFGHDVVLKINEAVSDANILTTQLNIPTILFGPNGRRFHQPDEYVEKASLFRYMEMLYEFLNSVLGGT